MCVIPVGLECVGDALSCCSTISHCAARTSSTIQTVQRENRDIFILLTRRLPCSPPPATLDYQVILVEPDDGYLSGECDADVEAEIEKGNKAEKRQRAALLLELQAMMRLRSPHTVNVYGAITSTKGKLILVMELLTGGDLRSLLKHSTERIPEPQARRIIQDVCAGMAFLHSKCAVHGDIKSANVLLDGEGRAKVSKLCVR